MKILSGFFNRVLLVSAVVLVALVGASTARSQAAQTSASASVPATTINNPGGNRASIDGAPPDSIVVNVLDDEDGNFATSGDRIAKSWLVEVHKDSVNGALVATSESGVIVFTSFEDGTYIISEADSASWINLGYTLNGAATSTTATTVTVDLVGGQKADVDFVNAPPAYGYYYRTFDADSLALDKDNNGKIGKPVAAKAVGARFGFTISPFVPGSAYTVKLKFNMMTSGAAVQCGSDTIARWTNTKEVSFAIDPENCGACGIFGTGSKPKPVEAECDGVPNFGKTITNFIYNYAALPEPNRVNGLVDVYERVFATSGLIIGENYGADKDSAKLYGWLQTKKYTDVLATLYQKGATQNGPPNHGFDDYLQKKHVANKQSTLPPGKYNNQLLGDLIALKINIAMCDLDVTGGNLPSELTLGNLLCQVDSNEISARYRPGRPTFGNITLGVENGGGTYLTISDLSAYGDTIMMGWQEDSTYSKGVKTITVPVHHFENPAYFVYLDSVVHNINNAFEGPIDTLSFGDSLVYKGTRRLQDVSFLAANPNVAAARAVPFAIRARNTTPLAYKLEQNYPNPFNPTTTIQFTVPRASIVSMKVYNILGQQVASLLDHANVNAGAQSLTFNASNLASGMYFYRLIIGSFNDVRKMILLK